MIEDIMARKKVKPTVHTARHPSGASAAHLDAGDGSHVVAYDSLRVLITKEDGVWLAQGLEIDYAVDGESLADVKKRFEDGLAMSIESNLRVYNNIELLLRNAPEDIWKQWYDAKRNALRRFTHSLVVATLKQQQELPFEAIQWLEVVDSTEAA